MKKIFITGVSRGLGKALAEKYLSEKWAVSGISRSELPELLQGKINHARLDLQDNLSIRENIRKKFSDLKSLDLLILNAAVLPVMSEMRTTSLSDMKKVFDINLWANKELLDFFLAETAVKQVIAISSGASVSGSCGWNSYALSKASLNMLVKLYAGESLNTHFVALAPGLVETLMQKQIRQVSAADFEVAGRIQEQYKLGLVKKPAEVAEDIFSKTDSFRSFLSGSYIDIRTMKDLL